MCPATAGSGSGRRAAASGGRATRSPDADWRPSPTASPPTRSARSPWTPTTRAATRSTPAPASRTARATPRPASGCSSRTNGGETWTLVSPSVGRREGPLDRLDRDRPDQPRTTTTSAPTWPVTARPRRTAAGGPRRGPDPRHLRDDGRRLDVQPDLHPAAEPGPAVERRRLVPGRREPDRARPERPEHALRRAVRLRRLAASPRPWTANGTSTRSSRRSTRPTRSATGPSSTWSTSGTTRIYLGDSSDDLGGTRSCGGRTTRASPPASCSTEPTNVAGRRCRARRTGRRGSARTASATPSAGTTCSWPRRQGSPNECGSAGHELRGAPRVRGNGRSNGRAVVRSTDAGANVHRHDERLRGTRRSACTPTSTRSCSTPTTRTSRSSARTAALIRTERAVRGRLAAVRRPADHGAADVTDCQRWLARCRRALRR